jgi:endonuclease YncB( thermonuclease family)
MPAVRRIATLSTAAWLVAASGAVAAEMLPGPYSALVERVVDGDTLGARVRLWLGQDLAVLVRIRGIDAPELRGRCDHEKEEARAAASALTRLTLGGAIVLTRIEGDKYFGRVVADVTLPDGEDLGTALVAAGYARLYDGSARGSWCPLGASLEPSG